MSGLERGTSASRRPYQISTLINQSRVWLVGARDFLNTKCPSPGRYFHGFDVSPAQFPSSPPIGVEFSVQNILDPFPAEHHNRYDLVYVRMLVAALGKNVYQNVVQNLLTILSKHRLLFPLPFFPQV